MAATTEVCEFSQEAIELTQKLLQIDTTNPPGNESKAAEFLKSVFEREGIQSEMLESEPGRGSVFAYLPGENTRPRMLWLSHLDVVPATNIDHWRHPPFSAEIEDNWIYARGAIDTKCLTAVEAMALIQLKRSGAKLKSPVDFGAVADEEMGGRLGAKWLAEKHPDKVNAEYVLNEGGGMYVEGNGKLVYLIETSQKGICWVKTVTRGKPCHASTPDLGENAVTKMATAIQRIASHVPEIRLEPDVRTLMESLARVMKSKQDEPSSESSKSNVDSMINELTQGDKEWRGTLRALTRMTMVPTVVKGGVKENIVPDYAEGVVDCRLLPGQTTEYAVSELKRAAGDVDIEFTPMQYYPASTSPVNTPLFAAVKASMQRALNREITLSPGMSTGATDSRFLRKLGSIAYGFMPYTPPTDHRIVQSLIHNVDERIHTDSITTGTKFFIDIAINPPA